MKTSAEKSSTRTTTTAVQLSSKPFFAKAGGGNFFAPVSRTGSLPIQMKLAVNKPGDAHEQEADRMADKVMRMPATDGGVKDEKFRRTPEEGFQRKEEEKLQKAPMPEEKIRKKDDEKIRRVSAPEDKLQRRGDGTPTIGPSTQSAIQNKISGGQHLSGDVRGYMEPRFGADFSTVRIHNDPESAALSNQLSARAFTYQNHIFFSRDQYQPGTGDGKQLLAHELTHTIQQGHAIQRISRVSVTVTQPHIQRSAIGEIRDWIAGKANNLPGFRMFTVILGMNPINMSSVDRSAANILRALIEFMPGGVFITTALDNHGVFNKIAGWVESQIRSLGMVSQMFINALTQYIGSLGPSALLPWKWGDIWNQAMRIFTAPIDRLKSFAAGLVKDILKFVKDAILKPLAALAQGTRGYDLLKAVLGEDPITGEPVPRTADTLIGGFMKLIGQEEIWENIKKGKAVARAWAWFQNALTSLLGLVRSIPRRVINTISSLTFQDIITVAGAFGKIVGLFANIAGDFLSWGLKQVISLLEILFSVVAPGVMPYIAKAKSAFTTILKNPIGFVGNLVRAGKLGFQMFAKNILEHLKTALIKWLTGPLGEAGVYIPKSFDLLEIIKLVLSVLGLTWQNIRSKLVKIIPEPVLVVLEKTAGILVTLVKDGPVAAWEQIKEELRALKDQLISQVIQMVTTEIVKAAVVKLVSMLNPAGAIIQAIIAIYNTVTFFIEKINQIAAVVASFIDSIAAIAAGQVENAAKKVEQTMANMLTVIIAFLAKFIGLGNVPEKLVGIVKKVRQWVDKGLDKIVAWLGKMLNKLAGAVKSGVKGVLEWWKKKISIDVGGEKHSLYFQGEEDSAEPMVASSPRRLENFVTNARENPKITGNSKKKESLDRIAVEISTLRKIRNDLRPLKNAPEEKRKPHLDKLEISFAKIGTELGVILADSQNGTKNAPIPIPWPKPAYMNYPKLFLFNQGSSVEPKWKLSAEKQDGTLMATYFPTGNHNIATGPPTPPAELASLGIQSPYQLDIGTKIGPLSDASTPGGDTINSKLRPYGWDVSKERKDGDHVVEIQFGGPNELVNLWPLDLSMNRGAGSRLSKQQVDLDGQKVTIDWLKKVKKKPGEETEKYFFKVPEVTSPK